ncbi:MAG: endopeptidase La [Thermoanaerobaculia bacterium]|nr:endopeptidase La [Thermoanaerobaculia bacterium]
MSSPTPTDPERDVEVPDVLPVLPLTRTVVFPWVIVPLSVDPEHGVLAVDQALSGDRLILLSTRKDSEAAVASTADLESVGTVGRILRMLKLPDGNTRILVQGLLRARLDHLSQVEPYPRGRVERLDEPASSSSNSSDQPKDRSDEVASSDRLRATALLRNVRGHLDEIGHLGREVPDDILTLASHLEDPGRLADLVASNLDLDSEDAQAVLEVLDPVERLARVEGLLAREIELLAMQHEISSQAQGEIDRSHREYFLRQQLRAIQEELGETDELAEEVASFRTLATEKGLPEEALAELDKQILRLERSHPESGENTVIRTYLDWLTGLPWRVKSDDDLDLDHARRVLDDDHYGLDQIKQRIVEYLAVRRLKPDSKGPILCFVGPPGVGKTSLGRSIARALGRKFVRLSLGGVRDEAEIRGHRRTYVGALPGRILQGLHQAGTSNPVFMLDEIDKIGSDHRGDPSAALLEVLDPEQNHAFRDHYLGLGYDLTEVLFITTANLLDPIQPAFLDRMEVLRLSGYTREEKTTIARRHLIPKQMDANGLTTEHLHFTDKGIEKVIRGYTREAGLRNLEREIASLCRKVAVRVASSADQTRGSAQGPTRLDARRVESLLGPEKHFHESLLDHHRVGVATGLAWTAAGGDLLLIETIAVPGSGKLRLTGQLGEVMRESAQAALSYARKWAAENGLDDSDSAPPRNDGSRGFFATHDVHVHAPAGSIPKDGPSAGITIATAILSLLTGRPVNRQVAMTGEITLRGDVLPIGGLKEKALAARAAGIQTIVIPALNERELSELPRTVRKDLDIHCLKHMDEVLETTLLPAGS